MANLVMPVLLVVVMVTATAMVAEGQGSSSETPSCASALVPCANYLGSANPPASCCTPIRETVKTQLKCLCGLLNDTALFKSLNINITQALELPKHCGITDTTSACRKYSASAPTPSSSSSETTTTTPPPPAKTGNGVMKLGWNWMLSLLVLLPLMVVRDFSVL